MPSDSDVIIISNYKTRVKYYGVGPVYAWMVVAVPLVVGLVLGAWVF